MSSCHRGVEQEGTALLSAIVIIFIIAYVAIALEHPIMINKSACALLGAGLLWTVYAVFGGDHALIGNQLNESVATTAQIVFFLIGAMTIVEVIDAHNGFEIITSQIRTRKQTTLMCIVCFVTFFLSAVLDNLTTTIVMASLMKKLSDSHGDRLFFAAKIVIAANAGGAWSVIGDVTTTMLWIGGQITPLPIPHKHGPGSSGETRACSVLDGLVIGTKINRLRSRTAPCLNLQRTTIASRCASTSEKRNARMNPKLRLVR
jgi:hypothetical protein